MCHITAQPPVQAELVLRFQQLLSRLATLKIENEEVSAPLGTRAVLQVFFENLMSRPVCIFKEEC